METLFPQTQQQLGYILCMYARTILGIPLKTADLQAEAIMQRDMHFLTV